MAQADAEHTGVVTPPPVIYVVGILLAAGLDWLWSLPVMAGEVALWTGVVLVGLGVVVNAWGVITLHRANTAIHPSHAATRMVAEGPFRFSRNPLYLGLNLVFIGLTLVINTVWGFVFFVPVLLIMHFGVILREEAHLRARFGDEYERYCRGVRRYL